jgi:hypothetical protein
MLTQSWLHRRPQNVFIGIFFAVLGMALAIQGLRYISDGTGGLVPFLMLIGGPVLSIYYIWYFNFYKEKSDV